MARSREDLIKLLADFKNWFELDLGAPFDSEALLSTFDDVTKQRLRKFVDRRLGHLPDADYFQFCVIFDLDRQNKLPDASVRAEELVAVEAPKAEEAVEQSVIVTSEIARRGRGRPRKN